MMWQHDWPVVDDATRVRNRSGFVTAVALACMAMADASGAARSRSLAEAMIYEKGEIPAVVKVSSSLGDFNGFFLENIGSTYGKSGERFETASDGQHLLEYDHSSDEWVLRNTEPPQRTARCRSPQQASLPLHGTWEVDGSKVQIDMTGLNPQMGTKITIDPERLKKLHELFEDEGAHFDPLIGADGKKHNERGDSRGSITNPNNVRNNGDTTTGSRNSHHAGSSSSSSGGPNNNTSADQDEHGSRNSHHSGSSNSSSGGADQHKHGSRNSHHAGSSNSSSGGPDSNASADHHKHGSRNSDHAGDDKRNTSNHVDSNNSDQTTESSGRAHNSDDVLHDNTTNAGDVADSTKSVPPLYKILILGVAVLSVICACVCMTGSFRCLGRGKEGVEQREPLPDHSDMEDVENKAFMR